MVVYEVTARLWKIKETQLIALNGVLESSLYRVHSPNLVQATLCCNSVILCAFVWCWCQFLIDMHPLLCQYPPPIPNRKICVVVIYAAPYGCAVYCMMKWLESFVVWWVSYRVNPAYRPSPAPVVKHPRRLTTYAFISLVPLHLFALFMVAGYLHVSGFSYVSSPGLFVHFLRTKPI